MLNFDAAKPPAFGGSRCRRVTSDAITFVTSTPRLGQARRGQISIWWEKQLITFLAGGDDLIKLLRWLKLFSSNLAASVDLPEAVKMLKWRYHRSIAW
jgi:hypothetical protein